MAGQSQQQSAPIVGINVTPLVDITLVLLIIFIVTARIVAAPAVPLDLPSASTSESVQIVFSVVLPETGAVSVNGEAVADDAELLRRAKQELAKDAELRAVISASGAVPHRRVIHLLDLLRSAGLRRIAFGTIDEEVRAP
jgi:biopolymer transport protein TolR